VLNPRAKPAKASPTKPQAATPATAASAAPGDPTAASIVEQLIGNEQSAADKAREFKRRHREEKAAKEAAERARVEEHRQRVREGRKKGSDFRDFLKERRDEARVGGDDMEVTVLV